MKISGRNTAKPRFAVALSFFNDLKEPVFETFESGKGGKIKAGGQGNENEFKIMLHEDLPGERFIEGMTIQVYLEKWDSIAMGVTGNGANQIKAVVEGSDPDQFKNLVLKRRSPNLDPKQFLSVAFNKTLSGKTGYKQYNYNSPWIFPINIIDKKAMVASQARTIASMDDTSSTENYLANMIAQTSGYRVEVSSKAPDFKWYRTNFSEYSTGVPETKKTKDVAGF